MILINLYSSKVEYFYKNNKYKLMKNIFVIIICLQTSIIAFGQEIKEEDSLYSYLDGSPIKMDSNNVSVNDIFTNHFSEYELCNPHFSKVIEEQGDYVIVYQTFSYEPLFIVGSLTEKDKKNLNQVIKAFRKKYKNRENNIENNFFIESDLKKAIKAELVDMFFIKTLGKPNSSYADNDGFMIFTYNGVNKIIDLIFENGQIKDYKVYNGY